MQTLRSSLSRFSRHGVTIALALVFGFLGSQAATIVSARGDTNVIDACITNISGQIRVVGANATCRRNEYHVDWNTGGTAPAPISGLVVVWNSASQETNPTLTVSCPEGKKAIGGGVETLQPSSVYESRPIGTGITEPYYDNGVPTGVSGTSTAPTGWTARYAGNGQVLAVYAICANAVP